MVEFGSGNSALWFAARVGHLLSIEDDADWFAHIQRELACRRITNVRHELRTAETYADLSSVVYRIMEEHGWTYQAQT